uniref:Uncharacterized protein n=1 Tax=Apteryx owenii TaxID=8824 RepID=A0A8B9Q270_APTOW
MWNGNRLACWGSLAKQPCLLSLPSSCQPYLVPLCLCSICPPRLLSHTHKGPPRRSTAPMQKTGYGGGAASSMALHGKWCPLSVLMCWLNSSIWGSHVLCRGHPGTQS